MFGFLSAPCSTCHRKEHSVYRAHFCGLCNRLRQDYGLPARFLVNRDATFLSLLGSGLTPHPDAPVSNTCCNPLAKPRELYQDGRSVSFAAAVTVCGLNTKLHDEIDDRQPGCSRMALRGAKGLLQSPFRKAQEVLKEQNFPVAAVQEHLAEQTEREQEARSSGHPDLEALSQPTATSFGQILGHCAEQARDSLEQIGRSLGRIIYSLDAYQDRSLDRQRQQFNPFLLEPALAQELPARLDRDLQFIQQGFERLPLYRHQDLLGQILGSRLRHTCAMSVDEKALQEANKRKKKERYHENWHCCDCCGDCCIAGCDPGDCDCDGGCCDCTPDCGCDC